MLHAAQQELLPEAAQRAGKDIQRSRLEPVKIETIPAGHHKTVGESQESATPVLAGLHEISGHKSVNSSTAKKPRLKL